MILSLARRAAEDGSRSRPRWLGSLIGLGGLIGAWELAALLEFSGRHVIPTPQSVVVTIFHDPGYSVWVNLGITAHEAAFGWLWGNLVALLLAVLFILVPALEGPLLKLALASYCLPIIAIGPILTFVLHGDAPQSALAGLLVFFPSLVGVVVGLRSADRQSLDVIRACGGGAWTQLVKVRLRAALPSAFSGFQIAAPSAILGAIVGEFLGQQGNGLGIMMIDAEQALNVDRTWGIALFCTLAAGAAYLIVGWVGRLVAPWAPRTGIRR